VDTNHGHTDGPRSVSNAKSKVRIVRLLVLPILHIVDDFGDSGEYIRCECLSSLELLKKGFHVVG